MERYEIERKSNRIKCTQEDMNYPNFVQRIEGRNNCIEDYTSVGAYMKKLHAHKYRMFKKYRTTHRHQVSQNSTQKILFTINNPEIKIGDIEVEDINIDSENDVGEDRDKMNSSYRSHKKKRMNDLNDDARAFSIPKSLSVNNKDHSKGPNVFLLRDKIIGECEDSLFNQLKAVYSLAVSEIDMSNRVNYRTVLRDLSNNLHTIKHQSVLLKTIELLQHRGSDALVDNLN